MLVQLETGRILSVGQIVMITPRQAGGGIIDGASIVTTSGVFDLSSDEYAGLMLALDSFLVKSGEGQVND